MNLNNFTLKAQESVQQAFNIADAKGQQAVECAHLLHGVLSQAESITGWLFGKIGVSNTSVIKDIEKLIDTYPRVSGGEHIYLPERQKLSEKQMIMLQR